MKIDHFNFRRSCYVGWFYNIMIQKFFKRSSLEAIPPASLQYLFFVKLIFLNWKLRIICLQYHIIRLVILTDGAESPVSQYILVSGQLLNYNKWWTEEMQSREHKLTSSLQQPKCCKQNWLAPDPSLEYSSWHSMKIDNLHNHEESLMSCKSIAWLEISCFWCWHMFKYPQ